MVSIMASCAAGQLVSSFQPATSTAAEIRQARAPPNNPLDFMDDLRAEMYELSEIFQRGK